MKIEQQVSDLWDQALDEGMCDSENISFETFLGAQYARRVLSKHCKLTAQGKQVVEEARDALSELLGESEDDEDEDMWLGDIGDEYMDEDILIQFLNEYYVVFPKKLPEAESE